MNWADMILDTVGVANMDEVKLSDMIVSGVIFSKFTSLNAADAWQFQAQTYESLDDHLHYVVVK